MTLEITSLVTHQKVKVEISHRGPKDVCTIRAVVFEECLLMRLQLFGGGPRAGNTAATNRALIFTRFDGVPAFMKLGGLSWVNG